MTKLGGIPKSKELTKALDQVPNNTLTTDYMGKSAAKFVIGSVVHSWSALSNCLIASSLFRAIFIITIFSFIM